LSNENITYDAGVTVTPASDCVGGGANNRSFPQAVGGFRALWATEVSSDTMLGCITNAAFHSGEAFNSDIIQIKRAIAAPNIETNAAPLALPVTPADLSDNRYYIQSNLSSAQIFEGDIGAIPALGASRVWEYQHHIYYIREDSIGSSTEVVPVLVQGRLQANGATPIAFNMLVEGIERINFMFGVDTDDDGIINAYIPSGGMQEDYWDNANNVRILAVKLYVLVRAIREDKNYTNNNTYQMGDESFDANGDNYRRLLFSSTVSLHNARIESW
jgi:type IV pilus assembly protein PilW